MSIPQGHTNAANGGHIPAGQNARFTQNYASGGPSVPPPTAHTILKRAGRDPQVRDMASNLMIELYTETNVWQTLDVTQLAETLTCGVETIRRAVRKLKRLHYLEIRPSHTDTNAREVRFDLDPTPGGQSR